ncbi:unnamed protein product [Meloidogyne enterolobii]|uniref:Uncharacterized protein n=1 Tax=Meloidogyne enterolobii TaxID=390850 RepID=A0ACB0XX49_MELEN
MIIFRCVQSHKETCPRTRIWVKSRSKFSSTRQTTSREQSGTQRFFNKNLKIR